MTVWTGWKQQIWAVTTCLDDSHTVTAHVMQAIAADILQPNHADN